MSETRKRLGDDAGRVNPVVPVHVWRTPPQSQADLIVVAELEVYGNVHQHAVAALPNETGGFLLGRVGYDPQGNIWNVQVDEAIPVSPATQNPVHFSFTWRDVDLARRRREDQNKALIGWFHTHPDMGVFLSETDVERTHRLLFSEPFQVALVYDPVRGKAGYFFWEGNQILDTSPATWREFDIEVAQPK